MSSHIDITFKTKEERKENLLKSLLQKQEDSSLIPTWKSWTGGYRDDSGLRTLAALAED